MSLADYVELRAEVAKHLLTLARAWLGHEMKAGRVRLGAFDAWARSYADLDAVDYALEGAETYADYIVRPLYQLNRATLERTRGLADYLRLSWSNTQAQNEAASAFWDAVAGRFDEVRALHVDVLARRSAALMAWLERDAERMKPARLELWARYGMELDERASAACGGTT